MVIPVDRLYSSEKSRKYVGNDLRIVLAENSKTLLVAGNNCRIKVSENSGLVKVIGDSSEVNVLSGSGNIEYIGNNGKITLGLDVSEDVVSYVGNDGCVVSANRPATKIKRGKEADAKKMCSKGGFVNICNANRIQFASSLPNCAQFRIPNISINTISKHFKQDK